VSCSNRFMFSPARRPVGPIADNAKQTDDAVGAALFRIQLTFIASPLTLGVDIRELVMNETEVISRRRALSFLGLAVLAAAVPAAILPISEAEAQQPSPPTAPPAGAPPAGAQTGTERRQQRRTARTERRQERRMSRTKRRQSRRTGRKERRQRRRSTGAT
jgi:hypothetical protein